MKKLTLTKSMLTLLIKPKAIQAQKDVSTTNQQIAIWRYNGEYYLPDTNDALPQGATEFTVSIEALLKKLSENSVTDKNSSSEISPLIRPSGTVLKTRNPKAEFTKEWKEFFGMMPKFTGSGFAWQGMAEIANVLGISIHSSGFAVATGFGDCIGVGTGNALTHCIKLGCGDTEERETYRQLGPAQYLVKVALESYALYGIPSFVAGAIWQPMVNALIANGPVVTALGTGGACALAFFITLCVMRSLLSRIQAGRYIDPHNREQFVNDFYVSMWNVLGAAAAFTTTSFDTPFQSRDGEALFNAVKAGGTTLMGYTATRFPETLIRHIHAACPYEEEVVQPLSMQR